MTENLAVVKQPQEAMSITMTSNRLSEALSEEQKKRELIKTYIQTNLTPGVDFGRIKMNGRDSKECLFKPGAEKVCSLLHLNPVFKVDAELIPIVGEGVIPYICQLINRHSGEVEGEGRGACSIKEKQGNVNTAIKIAQKRAQIDAVLRVAAMSDQFTQDLEDMPSDQNHYTQTPQRKSASIDDLPPFDEGQDANVSNAGRCTFGKNKGKLWSAMDMNTLAWYANMFRQNIDDPSKAQYKEGNERQLNEVLNAMEEKGGM